MVDIIKFPDGYIAARPFGWEVVLRGRRRRIQLDKKTLLAFVEQTLKAMGYMDDTEKLVILPKEIVIVTENGMEKQQEEQDQKQTVFEKYHRK